MEKERPEKNRRKVPYGVHIAVLAAYMLGQTAPDPPINNSNVTADYPPPFPESYSAKNTLPELIYGESVIDGKAYDLADRAKASALPRYRTDWYENMFKDGLLSPDEEEELYATYYSKSPSLFVGTATRFGPLSTMLPDIPFYGRVIRNQMVRGYVLTGSGNHGYHHELKDILPEWAPNSVYGRSTYPKDLLLDDQGSTVYAYLAERRLGSYNQPVPVKYDELTEEQKVIFDLTKEDSGRIRRHFVSVEEQQRLGPDKALDSGKFVSTVAGKSPNDIGRRFLLFKKEDGDRPTFYGVVLVIECIKRADWSGTRGASNKEMQRNPMVLRSQTNPQTGEEERWAFDLPDELYYDMGGNGGPVYGVIGVDAQLLESEPLRPSRTPWKPR